MGTSGRLASGLIVVLVLLVVGGMAAQATPIYVDKNASGMNNGISWTDAYTDLQTALGAAGSGNQILVAAGVYYPGATQTSSFALKDGVALYGGYPTGGGTRDVAGNVTVLSGDIDTNDTTDANGVVTDPANIVGDNAYHVVTSDGNDYTTVLNGFTITGGNTAGSNPGGTNGGGMYNYTSSPTVTGCTFSGNSTRYRGGGMYNDNSSSPTVTNCTFSGNYGGGGGGMYNDNSSSPTVTGCTFSDNSSGTGGGMYNDNSSSPTVTGCTFSDNSSGIGGGMLNYTSSSPTVTNCTFSGNSAVDWGGGMSNEDSSSPTVTNCTFSGNSSDIGGGMYNYDSTSPTVRNTILWGDTASSGGNEIYNDGSSTPVVEYCVVQGGYASGTNIITDDPLLGTLGDYGGTTETIPLLPGSSAIDAASATYAPSTDQRGITRPQGAADDIGAYEAPPTVGDVNGDGVIDVLDVRLCLQIALGVIPGTAEQRQQADMNSDGEVTLTDAQLLADYVIGISH